MTYTQTGDKITLEMSEEDYEHIILALGITAGWVKGDGKRNQSTFYHWLDFFNRLNATNPKYTPYEIPPEYARKEPA